MPAAPSPRRHHWARTSRRGRRAAVAALLALAGLLATVSVRGVTGLQAQAAGSPSPSPLACLLSACVTPPATPSPAPTPSLPIPSLPVPSVNVGPALPPQPAVPFTGCSAQRGAPPASGDVYYDESSTTTKANPNGPIPDFHLEIDPSLPCLAYRVHGSACGTAVGCTSPAQDVDRSTDGGQTWTRVFLDTAVGVNGGAFALGALTVGPPVHAGGPGVVWLGERGNGDSAIVSTDGGEHWAIASNGLGGLPVIQMWVAPSSPEDVYALLLGPEVNESGSTQPNQQPACCPAQVLLARTSNGGAAWSLVPLPHPGSSSNGNTLVENTDADVAIDPANPAHVFILWPQPGQTADLFTSSDGGQTVTPLPPVTEPASQLAAGRRASTGGLRLFLVGSLGGNGTPTEANYSELHTSDDGGLTWQAPVTPIPENYGRPELVLDPRDADRGLLVTHDIASTPLSDMTILLTSVDGFTTWGRSPFPAYEASFDSIRTPLDPATETTTPPYINAQRPGINVEADRFGDLYFTLYWAQAPDGDHYFAPFVAGTILHQRVMRYPPPTVAAGSPPSLDYNGVVGAAAPLQGCQVGSSYWTVAFDGVDLLYTDPPADTPQSGTGYPTTPTTFSTPADELVVHRLNPLTCAAELPDLVITFTPSDLEQLADRYRGPCTKYTCSAPYISSASAHHPGTDALTYDQSTGRLLVTIDWIHDGQWTYAGSNAAAQRPDPVFAARLQYGATTAAATPLYTATTCNGTDFHTALELSTLAADPQDGSLWGCDADGFLNHMSAAGTAQGTCMNQILDDNPAYVLSWLVPRHGQVMEFNDNFTSTKTELNNLGTLYIFDSSTCQIDSAYEGLSCCAGTGNASGASDAGLACDPLTDQSGQVGGPAAALWARASTSKTNAIQAYALPADTCPLTTAASITPTLASIGATVSTVAPGTQLCLDPALTLHGLGAPVAGETVTLAENGRTLGTVRTDVNGRGACVPYTPTDLGVHHVTITYAGDNTRYLGSTGEAVISVGFAPFALGSIAPLLTPPVAVLPVGPAPEPVAPLPVQVAPGAAVANQPPVQQASQAQAQPAAATQREEQHQLAFAMQRTPDDETSTVPSGGDASPAEAGALRPDTGGAGSDTVPGVMGVVTTMVVLMSLAWGLSHWRRRELSTTPARVWREGRRAR